MESVSGSSEAGGKCYGQTPRLEPVWDWRMGIDLRLPKSGESIKINRVRTGGVYNGGGSKRYKCAEDENPKSKASV
jgi:hypothetical protein